MVGGAGTITSGSASCAGMKKLKSLSKTAISKVQEV
jgi:hypothetical protein